MGNSASFPRARHSQPAISLFRNPPRSTFSINSDEPFVTEDSSINDGSANSSMTSLSGGLGSPGESMLLTTESPLTALDSREVSFSLSPLSLSPPVELQFDQEDDVLALEAEESEPMVFRAFKEMASPARLNRLFLENPTLLQEFIRKFEPKIGQAGGTTGSGAAPKTPERKRSAELARKTSLDRESASKLNTILQKDLLEAQPRQHGATFSSFGATPPAGGTSPPERASHFNPARASMYVGSSPRRQPELPPINTMQKSSSNYSLNSQSSGLQSPVPQSPSKYGPHLPQVRMPRTPRKVATPQEDHLLHTQVEFKAIHGGEILSFSPAHSFFSPSPLMVQPRSSGIP